MNLDFGNINSEMMQRYCQSHYLRFQPRPNTPTDQMESYVGEDFCGGKIALGGTGSAKTVTSCFILAREIYRNRAPQPNTPIWVGSQTYDLVGSIWSQALSRYITPDQIKSIRWRKAGLFPEIVMLKPDEYGNSFNIHFFSYEQGRQALQSSNVWMALLDEQAPPEVLEEVWGRLRTWRHPNMLLYALTPLEPDPWLEDLYERKKEPEIAALWKFYSLDTIANTFISSEWKDAYLNSLPPDVRLTRQYGMFASYKGAVYPEFTNDCIIPPFEIEKGNKYIGVDFGYHNPAACWMIEKEGVYYVIDDMQLHDEMPDIFANKIKMKNYDHTWRVIVDTEDAISVRYLNNAGIITSYARKNVLDGINNLKSLMFCKKFKVFNTCKATVKSLKGYQWREGTKIKDAPDEPKKLNDHLADCARYVCYTTQKSIVKEWAQLPSTYRPLVRPQANPVRQASLIDPTKQNYIKRTI